MQFDSVGHLVQAKESIKALTDLLKAEEVKILKQLFKKFEEQYSPNK